VAGSVLGSVVETADLVPAPVPPLPDPRDAVATGPGSVHTPSDRHATPFFLNHAWSRLHPSSAGSFR
jgi:hypothetical protein